MNSSPKYAITQLNDQTLTNTTTLTDSELKLWIPAGRKYIFQIFVPFTLGGVTSGYKFELTLPSGVSFLLQNTKLINDVSLSFVVTRVDLSVTLINGALATAGTHVLEIRGTVVNGSTAGFVVLRFAQNTADPVNGITLLAGSSLELTEVTN